MHHFFLSRRWSVLACCVLSFQLWATPVAAQVTDVVVGVTPTCPYGISACWGGIFEALKRLDGVERVTSTPDAYNCTAQLRLKGGDLPDLRTWQQQIKKSVGNVYVFRGVEISAEGTVREHEGRLMLEIPGLKQPLELKPLEHKLQWNFKKHAARQAEPDEKDAYQKLAAAKQDTKEAAVRIQVTGPLQVVGETVMLEVREFFVLMSADEQ